MVADVLVPLVEPLHQVHVVLDAEAVVAVGPRVEAEMVKQQIEVVVESLVL